MIVPQYLRPVPRLKAMYEEKVDRRVEEGGRLGWVGKTSLAAERLD